MPFLWIETLNKDVNSPFKKKKKETFGSLSSVNWPWYYFMKK